MGIKETTLNSVKWNAIGSYSNTIISFALGIILARLLSPSDYGTIGMISIFFAVANLFTDGGFSSALIRKKEASNIDFSTVFYFNLIVSSLCYVILFFSSPAIADFFNMPLLSDLIKVSGLSLIIGAFGTVQFTILTRDVNFKTPAIINVISNVLSGVIGVIMAFQGFGVWALVFQSLSNTAIRVCLVCICLHWCPLLTFSKRSFRELFGFGGKVFVSSLTTVIYTHINKLLIGKFYSPSDLGYYTKGHGTASLPMGVFWGVVGNVTYPILSKVQDDDEKLLRIYSKYIRCFSIIVFFIMTQTVVLANHIIIFLYSEKWIPAVVYAQVFCFSSMFSHITSLNMNLLLVKGRSDLALRIEIIRRIWQITFLLIALPIGPLAICVCGAISVQLSLILNSYYTGKYFEYGYIKQLKDFIPYFFMAVVCGIPSILLYFNDYHLVSIMLGCVLSGFLYFGVLWFKKDDSLLELIKLTPAKKWIKI